MVRCPDTRTIQRRLIEQRLAQARCKYGMEEIKCSAWYNFCKEKEDIKPISCFERCYLSGSDVCPLHVERKMNGLKVKSFTIDNKKYRQLSSTAHYQIKKFNNNPLFLTLTFPPFKKYCNDKEINKLFSKFMEKIRRRHNCKSYIGVREFGSKNNRVHFHILISIDFIAFPLLNRLWCNTISDYCDFAPNAIQSDPKTRFIRNPVRAMRYVCKYFSKSKGKTSESRLVFISNNLLSEKIFSGYYDTSTGEAIEKRVSVIKKNFGDCNYEYFTVNDLLNKYKSISVCHSSDFTTAFRINDKLEFEQFCNDYLYKIFNLGNKNAGLYTDLPDKGS